MRLGILVSGRGSNLEAILAAVEAGRLPRVEPVVVIGNRAGAGALAVAAARGVAVRVLARSDFADADARDARIGQVLDEAGVELAVLAGYDQRLRPAYFAAFGGRTLNIHPSLLPRHGGRGMMGIAVHRAVLDSGDRETGVTIHEVTEALDAGPVLVQLGVPVHSGDTAELLAERVLAVEHRAMVDFLGELSAPGGLGRPIESHLLA